MIVIAVLRLPALTTRVHRLIPALTTRVHRLFPLPTQCQWPPAQPASTPQRCLLTPLPSVPCHPPPPLPPPLALPCHPPPPLPPPLALYANDACSRAKWQPPSPKLPPPLAVPVKAQAVPVKAQHPLPPLGEAAAQSNARRNIQRAMVFQQPRACRVFR